MKLKLDLHDIYNRGTDIDRALNDIKARYHRVDKDSKNFGRLFVHFKH